MTISQNYYPLPSKTSIQGCVFVAPAWWHRLVPARTIRVRSGDRIANRIFRWPVKCLEVEDGASVLNCFFLSFRGPMGAAP